MKKLLWSLKKRVYLLNKTPRRSERLGAKWILDPSDWLQLRLLINKPFEKDQLAYFEMVCEKLKVTKFFDCGANFGLYSILVSKKFPHISTYAFEPVSHTREYLKNNIFLNSLQKQITIYPYALSDKSMRAEIMIDQHALGISSLSPDEKRNYNQKEEIELKMFDQEFNLKNDTLAFKIDVEGHEMSTIAGMKNTFANNNCFIQIETRPDNYTAVKNFFESLGYSKVNEITEDLYFCNYSFHLTSRIS